MGPFDAAARWHSATVLRRGRRCVAGGETLIKQRGDESDGSDGDQGADAVELVELGEIVEKQLQGGHAEERDGGDAGGAGFFPDAGGEKDERKKRPADGVGEVAREVAGEVEREGGAGRAEEVGDLEVEKEEAEDDAEGVEEGGGREMENAVAGRGEQTRTDENAEDRETVGVEISVKDRDVAARMIREDSGVEGEPGENDDEKDDAGGAEAGMGDAMEEPEQGGALECPGYGEPLAFELDRENQGDEKQGDAGKPSELIEPRGR